MNLKNLSKLARITGTGSYLPEKILSNADLEKMVETTDEWIVSRTGMKERRIAADDEFTSHMATKAATIALQDANIQADQIDAILVATLTPDHIFPSTAALLERNLGAKNAAALDIQAACTGYLYALSIAKAWIESGTYSNILVVAAEKLSTIVDYKDRGTCILFGDGASAAVVSNKGAGLAIQHTCLGADGEQSELLKLPAGGSRLPASKETVEQGLHYLQMEGREVYKHAVRRMENAAKECLDKCGLSDSDISWLVPHQANIRIMEAIAKRFGIPMERVFQTIHKYGNTSASAIAIALDELLKEHPVSTGDNLLLFAFGAGLTWGASLLTQIEE
ncbi:MAG: ketoacyl-ACP synthase III [Parachlamydiales bacterium]|nr:ketoacyl-ACP synthase III [Parachlamydiales bacterium]